MPQIVDLTNPQGKYGGSFQAIADILDNIGKVERLRQERSLNSKIINAVAMGGGPQEIAQILTQNQPQYATGSVGFLQKIASQFAPPSQIQQQVGQGLMQQAFQDPLDREYKKTQIESTKALTAGRREEAKHSTPDRMLRQADRYLRVVDDIMSEYWYTPKGAYKNKLLIDVQENRKKALDLIEKYAPNSAAAKNAVGQLAYVDKEIEKATGKAPGKLPSIEEQIQNKPSDTITMAKDKGFVVDTYPPPKDKADFDNTLSSISSEKEKDRWFELHYKPEYGVRK